MTMVKTQAQQLADKTHAPKVAPLGPAGSISGSANNRGAPGLGNTSQHATPGGEPYGQRREFGKAQSVSGAPGTPSPNDNLRQQGRHLPPRK
jgi:hypothetical protein